MIVATLASLASRVDLLERVIKTLEPQVDALCVYLNGYKKVPKFLNTSKVAHAILSTEAGWRGAEAKLWFWDRALFAAAPIWSDDDIALTCDDDIIYPRNYAERHCEALAARPGTMTCVHGSIMTEPFERYADSRMVARCREAMPADERVHIPGTGTMAFRRGDFDVNIARDVRWSHCVDVMTAIAAKAQGREIWTLARPRLWLQPLALPLRGMGIYRTRTGVKNDGAETAALKEAGVWPTLPHMPGFKPRNQAG